MTPFQSQTIDGPTGCNGSGLNAFLITSAFFSLELQQIENLFLDLSFHHHIGLNTWKGSGAPPPALKGRGLRNFNVVFTDNQALQNIMNRPDTRNIASNRLQEELLISDPSQNDILLVISSEINTTH